MGKSGAGVGRSIVENMNQIDDLEKKLNSMPLFHLMLGGNELSAINFLAWIFGHQDYGREILKMLNRDPAKTWRV